MAEWDRDCWVRVVLVLPLRFRDVLTLRDGNPVMVANPDRQTAGSVVAEYLLDDHLGFDRVFEVEIMR